MGKQGTTGFVIDDWQVFPAEGSLSRGEDVVRLEPKAMEVLVYLASHPGQVISREVLERDVWHGAVIGYDAVTNTVIKLRKALQDNARQPRYIATIPKRGYQLIAPVSYTGSDCPTTTPPPRQGSTSEAVQTRQPRSAVTRAILAGLGIIALLAGIAWLWPVSPTANLQPDVADGEYRVMPPSIVVLPFENLSDEASQEYLADGITEDIITDLSRLSNILVIASTTSFKYKGKPVLLEKVGTDLDVEYALLGSIRRLGDAVRVNAQLVNTRTGFNTWAQRYDTNISELFAVQDEVTHSIVKALAVKITNQERQRLAQRATASLEAYDYFQEGQRIYKINTRESNQQAREMYRKAIELDPAYGRAYGALAVVLTADFLNSWTDAPVATLDRALDLASKAVELDNTSPQTHWALGFVHLRRKEYEQAEEAATQSIRIAPNYADGYGLLGLIKANRGQAEEAIRLNEKAIRLNPFFSFEYLISYGMAYFMLGDDASAITILEDARERNENSIMIKLLLTACYTRTGRQEDAEWLADEVEILSSSARITEIEKTMPIEDPRARQAFLDDLRKAGLPE